MMGGFTVSLKKGTYIEKPTIDQMLKPLPQTATIQS